MTQVLKISFVLVLSLFLHLAILQIGLESGQTGNLRRSITEISLVQTSTPRIVATEKIFPKPPVLASQKPDPPSPVKSRESDLKSEDTSEKSDTTSALGVPVKENVVEVIKVKVLKDGTEVERATKKEHKRSNIVQPDQSAHVAEGPKKSKQVVDVSAAKKEESTQREHLVSLTVSSEVQTAIPRYDINPAPIYPDIALRKGWEGNVLLRVDVKKNGSVEQVKVAKSSGFSALDRSAIRAVRRWQFFPSTIGGLPVDGRAMIPIAYDLP